MLYFFKSLSCYWILAVGMLLISPGLMAHQPGLSSMDVVILADRLQVKTTFAYQEIEALAPMDKDLDAEVSDAEKEAAKPEIAALVAARIRVTMDRVDYFPAEPGVVTFDEQNNVHILLNYPKAPAVVLELQSLVLALLADGHQQYLTIKDGDGKNLAEKMLTKTDNQLTYTVLKADSQDAKAAKTSNFAAFSDFFKLGVEHILTGYDHLLFLLGLLAVTHSFWPAIKIITFFTIAHSITLACAGLNVIELPSSFVEPFIAATIVYVGVENLLRGDHPKGRHWLTFGFGLIHGFGFASVLQEMEISSGSSGVLLPLLSFNLGIEAGQITVAAIVLPLIWQLNNKPEIAQKFLKICSAIVSMMGGYWLIERTLL